MEAYVLCQLIVSLPSTLKMNHHLLINSLASDEHVNVTILNITKNTPLRLRQKCRAHYLQYPVIIIFRRISVSWKFYLEFWWSCFANLLAYSLRQVKRIIRQMGLRRRGQSSDIGEIIDVVEVSNKYVPINYQVIIKTAIIKVARVASKLWSSDFILAQQKEISGSGSCVGYRQMHQRIRNDHKLVVSRWVVLRTFVCLLACLFVERPQNLNITHTYSHTFVRRKMCLFEALNEVFNQRSYLLN